MCFGHFVGSNGTQHVYPLGFSTQVYITVASQGNTQDRDGFHLVNAGHINLTTIKIRCSPAGVPSINYISIGN